MSIRFNRGNFFKIYNGELDWLSFQWLSLKDYLKNVPMQNYMVTAEDEGRLDVISYRIYNTIDYWWVLGYVNDIINPFDIGDGAQVGVGTVLKYPSLRYIELFYQKIRSSQRGSTDALPIRSV